MTFTQPTSTINRDRFGRPLVIPPDGGKAIPYTRCTTYVDCLEDKFNLQKWQQRMVAIGLADRPDLLLAVAAHRDDKKHLGRICDDAIEAARGSAAATTGTALHSLTEVVDRGQELPVVPDDARRSIDAYQQTTSGMTHLAIEQFCVLDDLQIGGTPDRVVTFDGRNYIADVKTGSLKWGAGKIAQQLAVYSRCQAYDVETGQRTALPQVDQDRAIVIHLPAGEGRCDLYWIDIRLGWEAVQLAGRVRAFRKFARNGLLEPFGQESLRRPA